MSLTSKLTTIAAAGAGGADSAWITKISNPNSNSDVSMRGVVADADGTVYAVGKSKNMSYGNSNFGWFLMKYDIDGNHLWTEIATNTNRNMSAEDVQVMSNGNIVVAGAGSSSGGNGDQAFLIYDSNGNVQHRKTWDRSNGYDQAYGVHVPSGSNDIFTAGLGENADAFSGASFMKLDSTANSQSFDRLVDFSADDTGKAVFVDSSGFVIVVGHGNGQAGIPDFGIIARLNSSGLGPSGSYSGTWGKRYGASNNSHRFNDVVIDSNDNIYVVGHTQHLSASRIDCCILKFNTSGSIVWQKALVNGAGVFESVDVDTDGNIYAVGQKGNTEANIVKWNPSGGVEWQLKIVETSPSVNAAVGYGLRVSGNSVLVTGTTDEPTDGFIVKLPLDGSITGTYGGYTISNTSYAVSNSGFYAIDNVSTSGFGFSQSTNGMTTNSDTVLGNTLTSIA